MGTLYLVPSWNRATTNWGGEFADWKIIEGPLHQATGEEDCILVQDLCLNKEDWEALKRLPREKLLLWISEPPAVLPANHVEENHRFFDTILTYADPWVDGVRYHKTHFPSSRDRAILVPFEMRDLCTLICSRRLSSHPDELYSRRQEAIEYFEGKPGCHFYGRDWEPSCYSHYRGEVGNKRIVLAQYRFCLCFENSRAVGYITEKIFDAFWANCVPVYLGAPNVTDSIPADCFVDASSFDSWEQLEQFMRSMSKEEYFAYLSRINAFLESEMAHRFSFPYLFEQLRRRCSRD